MKKIFLYVYFIVVVSLLMMSFMIGVYHIPAEKIRENVSKSAEIMSKTPEHPRYPIKFPGAYIDTWTDARMLNMAGFIGIGSAFSDSLLNPRVHYMDPPYISLAVSTKIQNFDNVEIKYYPRFWQGYLIFLKPLLIFFDVGGIRIINLFVQSLLLLFILILMYRRLGFLNCLAFVSAILFFNPINSWKCLEFATTMHLLFFATLWVLLSKKPDDNYMFFVIGAIEILFDWLTYPLVTLGIPLIIYINLYHKNLVDDVKRVLKSSFLWLSGYACMWTVKWIMVLLFTDQDIFEDVRESILHRVGIVNFEPWLVDITFLHAVMANFHEFEIGSLIYVFFFFSILIFYILKKRLVVVKNVKAMVLLGIGLMPFLWYAVLVHHSIHHPWMAHKILIISIYAVFSAVVCCFMPKKEN